MASGLRHATYRPFQTRFRFGSKTSISYPRCITQLAGLFYKRHATTLAGCDILSVYGFRFYFTPLTGVLFAFPSRYLFTIGSCLVFSLGSWSTRILTGFHVPRHTQDSARSQFVSDTRLSLSLTLLPRSFSYKLIYCLLHIAVLQPRFTRFRLFPLRSPLLGESLLISVPELLRWFTSLSLTSLSYIFRYRDGVLHRITPFGNPGVCGYVLLTPAYRSLSRPSSSYSS